MQMKPRTWKCLALYKNGHLFHLVTYFIFISLSKVDSFIFPIFGEEIEAQRGNFTLRRPCGEWAGGPI